MIKRIQTWLCKCGFHWYSPWLKISEPGMGFRYGKFRYCIICGGNATQTKLWSDSYEQYVEDKRA